MTTKRLAMLFLVLAAGFGASLALPRSSATQPVGIVLALPKFVGAWYGTEVAVSDKEHAVLGAETEFARKSYRNGRGDEIQVSIVLSGHDMTTSIHRPERCLPAQGWTVLDSRREAIPIAGRGIVPATRLFNVKPMHLGDASKQIPVNNINYYWFVGYDTVTGSHWVRTWIDATDSVFRGYNQRWAYVTVSATVTDNLSPGGLTEKQTDEIVRAFIRQLVPHILTDTPKLG